MVLTQYSFKAHSLCVSFTDAHSSTSATYTHTCTQHGQDHLLPEQDPWH